MCACDAKKHVIACWFVHMVGNCMDESLNFDEREIFLFIFRLFWPLWRCL